MSEECKCPGPIEDADDHPELFPRELLNSIIPKYQLGVCTTCGKFWGWDVFKQKWVRFEKNEPAGR